ncbi:hypothetical protein GGU11DRAFT_750165 [Lentinula aff. detonsa]|uniref:Uncharacterized protein n=1 Tax=Lentinula aff. detonsa TaxID=2804958 RepID=A0AA38KMY8_9AGAR|nr:hypothetical protein GGU10DRAFT_381007 [Lentinula aff. detonsa]KAJ3792339.1 hypothetical protein GGU11DRAFT_750165 [Lentinula aff. detonsa]
MEYKVTLQEHQARNPSLRPTSPNTVFAATSVNFGPRTETHPHCDAGNLAHGWCAIIALGDYNPNEGGHLLLWDLGLIIRFPPGSTILFPSALITHSNVPIQPYETRYSIVQYSGGGLLHWRNNRWCSDKTLLENSTAAQWKMQEDNNKRRWSVSLQKFTWWSDLVSGDWKGKVQTAAGLDELSELSNDKSNDEIDLPPKKHTRK